MNTYAQRFLEYFKLKPIVEYTFEMIKSVCQVATIMTNENTSNIDAPNIRNWYLMS